MKKIKLFISAAVILSLMLVSFGAQASGGSITVSADVFTDTCTVNASFAGFPSESVSVQVIPADVAPSSVTLDQVVYFNQLESDSRGNVTFEFPLEQSGYFTIRVHSMSKPGYAIEKDIEYVCNSDAKEVWSDLVASPEENLEHFLQILDVKDDDILCYQDDSDLHSYIKEYGSIGEFNSGNADALVARIKTDCEKITLLNDTLSEIKNAKNISQIKPIVTVPAKAEVLGITGYMVRYNDLDSTKIVDTAIAGKIFTKTEFIDAFIEALEDAENAEDEQSSSANQSRPSSSSGKGSSGIGASIYVPTPAEPAEKPSHSFADISGVAWATEAIASLYSQGIINGKSATQFAPHDRITREEFVKIALGVAGLNPSRATTAFSDVDASAWYAPYISSAVSAGIVGGYSDQVFGVGDSITRQDVAVILDRIHKLTSSGNAVTFGDEAEISDYAIEAVARLSAGGVINGSDGNFMPKANCTRAEAACMVYRMMSLIKEGK